MMNFSESINACKNIEGWEIAANFSVGGFEWLGFSQNSSNKMIIISSQKTTVLDCNNGKIEECIIDYDEQELIAICNQLPNEQIPIVGQYGGKLPAITRQGERIAIQETKEHIMKITFTSNWMKEVTIFHNYCAYVCGFSYDGNYFVLADDGGMIVMKRKMTFDLSGR